jgi:hypothetical protein
MADPLTHRWILAGFGPELRCSVLQITTDAGPQAVPMGFIYDHGTIHQPTAVTYGAQIGDDGSSPVACDARVWTDAGHGYHITGTVRGSSPSSQQENFWCVDGLATFECGGRLGAGMFETQELRGPAPWHRAVVGSTSPARCRSSPQIVIRSLPDVSTPGVAWVGVVASNRHVRFVGPTEREHVARPASGLTVELGEPVVAHPHFPQHDEGVHPWRT